MFRFILLLALLTTIDSAPVVGRKLLSSGPSGDAIGIIVLVSILFGTFFLYVMTALFRNKNMCYAATCCDKICPENVVGCIGCCDDFCNDECAEAGGNDCCICLCWIGCSFCDLFACPYENKPVTSFPRSIYMHNEDPKIRKLRQDMNEFSKKNKLKEKTNTDIITNQPPAVPNQPTNKDNVTLFITDNNEIEIND